MREAAGGVWAAGEVGVCACVVPSYGAVGGRFCEGQTVVVRAGPYRSAACVGARRQGDGWWCWGGQWVYLYRGRGGGRVAWCFEHAVLEFKRDR